jgi:hypothetical protein
MTVSGAARSNKPSEAGYFGVGWRSKDSLEPLTKNVGLLQLSAKDTSSKLLGSDLKLLPLVEKIY